MNKHGAGEIADGFDGPLGYPVLMMGSHTRETKCLALAVDIILKLSRPENAIVSEEGADFNAQLAGLPF